MNSACDKLGGQLDLYLSHELAEEARLEVERHLESCPACAAELETRARVRAQLQAAVRATPVAAGLEARVRRAVRTPATRPRTGLYAVAAAAAVVICVALVSFLRTKHNPEEAILAKTPKHLATLLNVGLRDHLHCAVFRKYSKQPEPAQQMAAELGPEYAGLVPLIQAKLPAGFEMIQAHHCTAGGRQYTHFIIAGGGKLVSLILTRARPDESMSNGIYQAGVDRFQVVGFETQDLLAYVISDLDAQQNLRWTANLASAVRQYVAAHSGWIPAT